MKKNKDPNFVAKVEQAIQKKYGKRQKKFFLKLLTKVKNLKEKS